LRSPVLRSLVCPGLAVLAAACGDNLSPGLASLEVFPTSAVHFPVIGDTIQLTITATDREGRSVVPADVQFASRDRGVARVDAAGRLYSVGDGSTYVVVRAGALADSVGVSVAQAKDSLVVNLLTSDPIVSLAGDTQLPLVCRAFDAGGNLLPLSNSVQSSGGTVTGSTCASLIARASGHDTLVVTAGGYQTRLAIVIAIRPILLSDPAIPLEVDSLPSGSAPWAPTLVRNSGGEIDLYFAAYRDASDQVGGKRGDLHRMVSSDGVQFRYAGVVLQHDPFPCSLRGTGIENVAIVPRSDGPGWRMYYAAGSDACYGWQVFSAVSPDQVQWTPEPGVRIPNGGTQTSALWTLPPWPAGEGMTLELTSSGEWRMLVGAYERLSQRENRFQITEWRSSNQVQWTYRGAVLTTRQVGPGARRSVYSPTVTDIAPGLKRMYFTGDNLDASGGASRIYSAVSLDGIRWEIEGIVLGDDGANYFYSTVVGDLLVFIRDQDSDRSLGSVQLDTR
jgi:hypothetical protein